MLRRPRVALIKLPNPSGDGYSDKLYRFRTTNKSHYKGESVWVETKNGVLLGKFEKYGFCLNPSKLKPVLIQHPILHIGSPIK